MTSEAGPAKAASASQEGARSSRCRRNIHVLTTRTGKQCVTVPFFRLVHTVRPRASVARRAGKKSSRRAIRTDSRRGCRRDDRTACTYCSASKRLATKHGVQQTRFAKRVECGGTTVWKMHTSSYECQVV